MHLFFSGPRILGIRPGIVLGPGDFRRSLGRPDRVGGSFLYVIQGAPGLIKIGLTTNPRERIENLQTGSPYALTFVAIAATPGSGFEIEERAHDILGDRRVRGEWFWATGLDGIQALTQAAEELREPLLRVSPDQADAILAMAAALPVAPVRPSRPPYDPLSWEKPLLITLSILAPIVILILMLHG